MNKKELDIAIDRIMDNKRSVYYPNEKALKLAAMVHLTWYGLARHIKRYPKISETAKFLKCSHYMATKINKEMTFHTVHTCYSGHNCQDVYTEEWD